MTARSRWNGPPQGAAVRFRDGSTRYTRTPNGTGQRVRMEAGRFGGCEQHSADGRKRRRIGRSPAVERSGRIRTSSLRRKQECAASRWSAPSPGKRTRREEHALSHRPQMSSGRLFLDRVARQHCPSPLHRHAQTTTHSRPAWSKPDISTLQKIGHFYFALTV